MRTVTIDLSSKSRRQSARTTSSSSRHWWQFWAWSFWRSRKLHLSLAIVVLLLVIISITAYLALKPLYDQAQIVMAKVETLKVAAKDQDLGAINSQLPQLQTELSRLQDMTKGYGFIQNVPILDKYYADSQHAFEAANQGLQGGQIMIEALLPYGDILGLKTGQTSQTVKPKDNEEKMAQLILLMPAILPSLDKASAHFESVKSEMDTIDPNRYPGKIAGYDIKTTITDTKSQISMLEQGIHDARPILEVLPQALGANQSKRYLILFQNDKELRPTGGFISSVAYVTFKQGKFEVSDSDDIYTVDTGKSYLPVPWPMTAYNNAKTLTMRDTNWSPDFKQSMQDFELYYNRSGKPAIDGIIALDTQFVEELMKLTGPVTVPGYKEPFTAQPININGAKVPQVIYQLEVIAQKSGMTNDTRKGVIGDLMKLLIQKVMAEPPTRWPDYLKMALLVGQEKHALLALHDNQVQALAEQHNFAGRIIPPVANQDYLHINDANLAGLKTNFYLQQKTKQDITVATDGTITKKVTITYTNTGKFDGWISATARNYTRLYVPKGSTLLKVSGGEQKVTTTTDLGYTVFDNFTTVKPLASQTMVFEYRLPFKSTNTTYPLVIQKQAGAQNWTYTTTLNGSSTSTLINGDTMLNLTLKL